MSPPPFGPWPGSSGSGGGGVTQIVAGPGISIAPPGGTGIVTITNSSPGSVIGAFPPINHLINNDFRLYQRQNPLVLVTRAATAARAYGPDRWTVTTQNAAGFSVGQNVSSGVLIPGVTSIYQARFICLTAAQKIVIAQAVEDQMSSNLGGNAVTFQLAARTMGAVQTFRLGLLQLLAPGVIDTIPNPFVSAFNGASVDPTFGANLSLVVPTAATGPGAAVVGNAVTFTPPGGGGPFVTVSGTFVPSALTLAVIPVLWSDTQVAVGNEIQLAETGLFKSSTVLPWEIPDPTLELVRARRYYVKTFPISGANSLPGSGIGIDTGEIRLQTAKGSGAVNTDMLHWRLTSNLFFQFTPTVTFFNPGAAGSQVRDETANVDCTGTAVGAITTNELSVTYTANAATIVGNVMGVHVTIDAEL